MKRAAVLVFSFFVALIALAEPRSGTFCRETAVGSSNGGPAAYARRAGGRYCDGALSELHAGPGDLPVIGVMVGAVRGDPGRMPVSLTVVAPPEPSEIAWPMQLQGVARSSDVSYRLDAALLSIGQPVVIGAESAMPRMTPRLHAEDVAWAAWSESPRSGRTYLPVVALGAAAGGAVQIIVRPTISTAYVTYTLLSASASVLVPETDIADNIKQGQPVSVTVPVGSPRPVVAKVVAVGNDGDTQVASVRLVRPGPPQK